MPLSQFLKGAIAGGIAGLIGDEVGDQIKQRLPHIPDDMDVFLDSLPEKVEQALDDIHKMAGYGALPNLGATINLFPQGDYRLDPRGRQHTSIFSATSVQVKLYVGGVGYYSPTLNAGWNALDLPPGSAISLPDNAAGSQGVWILYGDTSLGAAI